MHVCMVPSLSIFVAHLHCKNMSHRFEWSRAALNLDQLVNNRSDTHTAATIPGALLFWFLILNSPATFSVTVRFIIFYPKCLNTKPSAHSYRASPRTTLIQMVYTRTLRPLFFVAITAISVLLASTSVQAAPTAPGMVSKIPWACFIALHICICILHVSRYQRQLFPSCLK